MFIYFIQNFNLYILHKLLIIWYTSPSDVGKTQCYVITS